MSEAGLSPGPRAGTVVGHYEFVRRIGSGGMGEVYLARDRHLDRNVAIKLIRPDLIRDPRTRERFHREARLASQVVHPYVATAFDVLETPMGTVLVMEYIEGRTLEQILQDTRVSLESRLRFGAEIAEGLAAIHARGLVHRDLKPGNVMVTRAGHVKLLDLGLVRPAALPNAGDPAGAGKTVTQVTLPGTPVGTPSYMSPEQLRGEELDPRSDIFSLGVVLHELATGRHPFRRETSAETTAAILTEDPDQRDVTGEQTLPPGVRTIFARAVQKPLDKRYPTAEALAEDLKQILRTDRRALKKGFLSSNRSRVVLLAAEVVALVAVAVVVVSFMLPAPRIPVAFVPLSDMTGRPEGAGMARMISELVAAELDGSRIVRAAGPLETASLLRSIASDAPGEAIARRISMGMRADYVFAGTLYREGDHYIATMRGFSTTGKAPLTPVNSRDATAMDLARKLSSEVRRSLPGISWLNRLREDPSGGLGHHTDSEPAALAYWTGLSLRGEGKFGPALSALEQSTAEDPAFALAHSALATVLHDAGYGRRAREAAARAVSLAPQPESRSAERTALLIKASESDVYGRTDEFVRATGRLVGLYPDDPELQVLHATALRDSADYERALSTIDRALELDGFRPTSHLIRGEILTNAGRYEEAISSLEKADRIFALMDSRVGRALVLHRRGQVFSQRGDYEAAADALDNAADSFDALGRSALAAEARLSAANVDVLRGRPVLADGRLSDAAALARRIGNKGLLCSVLSSQGAQRFSRGDSEGALPLLSEAIDLSRQLQNNTLLLNPLSNLASLYVYTGQPVHARAALQETLEVAHAIGSTRHETNALALLADLEFREGNVALAVSSYERLLGTAGVPAADSAWSLVALAEVHQARGRLAEALERADAAVSTYRGLRAAGDLGHALVSRAAILAEVGRLDEAARDLDEAKGVALAPEAGLDELAARCAVGRVILLGFQERWAEARDRAEALLAGDRLGASAGTALRAAGEACLRLGEFDPAVDRAGQAVSDPTSPAPARIHARAVLAEALLRARKAPEALREARALLPEAVRQDLLLPMARAATVILSAGENGGELEEVRREGLRALETYIASIPRPNRATVLARPEIRQLTSVLERNGEPAKDAAPT